ncbi:hypothetical protein GCM10010970_28270 [Silvimonas iriomotensis]|uniref:Uncharacterized protein n=1 Tax=Silvimonas iriomotensis TaxID=449662 RepID=A0ABQ2PBC4_9NEIS|nr:hypothetical protein GCM10010970_28270 [Silvimonas iriomotensis]
MPFKIGKVCQCVNLAGKFLDIVLAKRTLAGRMKQTDIFGRKRFADSEQRHAAGRPGALPGGSINPLMDGRKGLGGVIGHGLARKKPWHDHGVRPGHVGGNSAARCAL